MKNIADIYIILSFCVYLLLSSVIFLICKEMHLNFNKKKSRKLEEKYRPIILKHLNYIEYDKKISPIEIKDIKELLNKKIGIKIFSDIIIEYNEINRKYNITKKYINSFEDEILRYIRKCTKKDEIVKNYVVYIIGEYRFTNYEIDSFLFDCLSTKSVYLTTTTLRTIAKLGSANKLIKALEVTSKNNKIINTKILDDVLDQFSGDVERLYNIMDGYCDFDESIQKSIVEYFKKNKNEYLKDTFLELLQSDISKEVKISIIKYFGVVKSELAKKLIIKILEQKDWEYRAVCPIALMNYIDEDTKVAMLNSIKDKNWYVRYNSAVCLLEFDDEEVTKTVLETKDKYAIEILNYAISIKNKTNKEVEVCSYD